MKTLKKIYPILSFILIIIFFFWLLKDSYHTIFSQLIQTPPKTILILIIGFMIYEFLNSKKMSEITKAFAHPLSTKESLLFLLESQFYSFLTFGSGTWLFILYHFKQKGYQVSQTVSIQIFQFIIDKMVLLVLASCTLAFLPGQIDRFFPLLITAYVMTFIIVSVLLTLCVSRRIHHGLVSFLRKWIKIDLIQHYINDLSNQLEDLHDDIKKLFKDKTYVAKIFGLGMIKFIFLFPIPCFILSSNIAIQCLAIFSSMSMIHVLVSIIPLPMPGGVGTFDFFYYILFTPIFGKISATTSLLLYRVPTVVLSTICGFMIFIYRKTRTLLKKNA